VRACGRFRQAPPSPATVASVIALVFAMAGTAVAATGGGFILGKHDAAATITSLAGIGGVARNAQTVAFGNGTRPGPRGRI
jgi:hypothetical protein